MPNGNGTKIRDGLNGRSGLILAIIGAIVGGTGGPFLAVKFGGNVFRPEPFTQSDAALLETRIERCEAHMSNHPDQTGRFDARLTGLEVQTAIILTNQQRIMTMLERK